jgi:hypothetical protein
MLNTNCGKCHVNGTSGGVSMKTYASLMASNVVTKGDPMNSLLYTTVYQGSHFATLTSAELQKMYDWITNGAPEK